MTRQVLPGRAFPLGAAYDGAGVNFALFSRNASAVELCLFDSPDAAAESQRLALSERDDGVWHAYVPGLAPGQLYGWRVHGPCDPAAGHRFNANKLLLDPYARAVGRDVRWDDALFGYTPGDPGEDLSFDRRDSAPFAPLAVVVDEAFDWKGDAPPRTPWSDTLIYEAHVKGLTKLHPEVPERLRGTYAGLATPPVIEHLRGLGVTAVELLPVHQHVDDRHLLERGLSNYWGYNTLGYFAPEWRYASDPSDATAEFKRMVRALHSAGIEVILDVVYNHTAEGSHLGPTLSWRGIDNLSYYRLLPGQERYYVDYTGCGNTFDVRQPAALRLVMDSLRYWAREMRVDGFRFDLAPVLGRQDGVMDPRVPFFQLVRQDPELSPLKLIAEPWDVGPDGYQLGRFPEGWAEWNASFRDSVRRLWLSQAPVSELATRLSGSSDIFRRGDRRPWASVNYVTSHDGPTLEDLVSYERKHNEANGEENRDGSDQNFCGNFGVEGPSDDPAVRAARDGAKRNLMATVLLSQGVPMLCAGDELGRTQRGNNNAYCQDNELSWVSWELTARKREFLEFVRAVARVRSSQPSLRRRRFFEGGRAPGSKDVLWFGSSGVELSEGAWSDPALRALGVVLSASPSSDTLILLFNLSGEETPFKVPLPGRGIAWRTLAATAREAAPPRGQSCAVGPRSIAVFSLDSAGQLDSLREAVRGVVESAWTPSSMYRLQLHRRFAFKAAQKVLPYLESLGIDAVYLSPLFKAQPGSSHGYDVVDPNQINPELGGTRDYESFCAAAARVGLGQVADIVPNHMGVAGDSNRFWLDVLEHGRGSSYAHYFDIDWDPVKPELRDKVLLPVLDDLYGRVLEAGQIRLHLEGGRFVALYAGRRLPVAPETWPMILSLALSEIERSVSPAEVREYVAIGRTAAGGDGEGAARRLKALSDRSRAVRGGMAALLASFNGRTGEPGSFDRLDALLGAQHYRLAHWRVASDEINYRRFFNINELAAVRTEDERVFSDTHKMLFRLIAEGKVRGLRVDHPDGLYDPPLYFRELQERYLRQTLGRDMGPPGALERLLEEDEFRATAPLFVVAEKVLDRKETLHEDWRVRGTVGYDALNDLNGLFVERANERRIDAVYADFLGHRIDFERLIYGAKKRFAQAQMGGEIEALAHRLDSISEKSRHFRDFTRSSLTAALREVIACFPVYRTYVSPQAASVAEKDERYIRAAVEKAKSVNPSLNPAVFDFLRDVLLLKLEAALPEGERRLYRDFVLRFQQLTAPVMAKGLEDTAFYVDNRLLSLNEVGGDPAHFGVSVGDFHRHNLERARRWPSSVVTSSTHDAKRSEDVRLRIDALSEMPEEWRSELARWAMVNEKRKTAIGEALEPRRNTEYLIYQTLLGAWPDGELSGEAYAAFLRRIWRCVQKAVREAQLRTSWMEPDREYEAAVRRFLEGALETSSAAALTPSRRARRLASEGADNAFLREFLPLQRRVSALGKLNALSAATLRLAMPGVVDVYQGTELWDYSLVDPDNRRPVDYKARIAAASSLDGLLARLPRERVLETLLETMDDGRIKLHLLREGLRARRRLPGLFVGGDYLPLRAVGPREENVVAFLRRRESRVAIAAAGRFFARLVAAGRRLPPVEAWRRTRLLLPDGMKGRALLDLYSGRKIVPAAKDGGATLEVSSLFAFMPAALLIDEGQD